MTDIDGIISNDPDVILCICSICSKSFSNKFSRNRHQLYCRKKHFSGQPKIRKSCAVCRRAKVKCNSGSPACHRCQEKVFACVYEKTAKGSTIAVKISLPLVDRTVDKLDGHVDIATGVPDSQPGFDWTPGTDLSIPLELCAENNWDFNNALDSLSTPQDSGYGEGDTLISISQWDSAITFDAHLSSFEFTLLPDIANFTHFDPIASSSMFEGPYLFFKYNPQHHDSVSRMSTVARRQSPFMPTIRPITAAIGHNFILQDVKVYPYLLLDGVELPPFIHTQTTSESGNLASCSGFNHLAICKSIIQMYRTRTSQTEAFIWRNIEAERQRFVDEYETATEWEALSMLQSMTIYILIRVFDDNDAFTIDFDVGLIQTMTVIAIKPEQSGFFCTGEVLGYRPLWQEWILMESKRRIVIILLFICLLFKVAPSQRGKALAGLSSLPLPATKALWHASTEMEWEILYDDMLLKRQGRRYLSYADLVFLGKTENASEDPRMGDLNGWLTTLDGLGVLVMMAATTF